jgi:hypothetical protein
VVVANLSGVLGPDVHHRGDSPTPVIGRFTDSLIPAPYRGGWEPNQRDMSG